MLDLPSWVVVMLPLGLVLAVFFFAWRFVRRGAGAVHRAASRGDVECLKRLLLADASAAGVPDLLGLLPLQYAASWGQVEAVNVLLEHGADVNRGRGWSPLHYAAAQGHADMAALLLDRGAEVNAPCQWDDSTPLHVAVIKKRPAMATIFLERGANVDARTKSAWTPLHFAASDGNLELARLLLDHGADFQAVNAGEQTPLQVALGNGHPDIVELARSREQ